MFHVGDRVKILPNGCSPSCTFYKIGTITKGGMYYRVKLDSGFTDKTTDRDFLFEKKELEIYPDPENILEYVKHRLIERS
jgi:hypothetical protein